MNALRAFGALVAASAAQSSIIRAAEARMDRLSAEHKAVCERVNALFGDSEVAVLLVQDAKGILVVQAIETAQVVAVALDALTFTLARELAEADYAAEEHWDVPVRGPDYQLPDSEHNDPLWGTPLWIN